jgi:uncharacterized protein (DUF983 family)
LLSPLRGAQDLVRRAGQVSGPHCRACGLDYGRYNVGDGPAAFLTLIIGALLVVLALSLDAAIQPPLWVHVLLWVPITAARCFTACASPKAHC